MSSTSIILPTRKRTNLAEKSIDSIVSKAAHQENLEVLLTIDADDNDTKSWLDNHYREKFQKTYKASLKEIVFPERLGYHRLNEYVNHAAGASHGHWLFIWNDDANMLTDNWDAILYRATGYFGLFRANVKNHNHPFALFPIIPRLWYEMLGYISPTTHVDRFIFEVSYRIMVQPFIVNIPIDIEHDRYDLTGNNNDEVYKERIYMEGDPKNPKHADSPETQAMVWRDSMKISKYLAQQKGTALL